MLISMEPPAQTMPESRLAAVRRAQGEPAMSPLFKYYPELARSLPRVSLGSFPTPVEKLDQVGEDLGLDRFYVKRDDLSGSTYGGNKVRKLEFLLADALRARAREVLTLGYAGSNHALATAICARRLGLKSVSMLMPQANAHYVRRNLLASYGVGAELRHCANLRHLKIGILLRLIQGWMRHGVATRFIAAGGSCPLGVVGYVDAAFELKDQVLAGELPEPDLIYVPLGSSGTSVGLTLGLKAAGLRSRVVAVRVMDRKLMHPRTQYRLLRDTAAFLRRKDPKFPECDVADWNLSIRDDCLGDGYARFTEKGAKATELMSRKAGIILNGSYSAKAFSAVIDDAAGQLLRDKTVLFWNTYNSRDLSAMAAGVDYHQLPRGFHRYFEEDVQPLDAAGLDR
jgi:1-aminocyclopropane-1-carboxylate deaminase/D-cysteine desulfhydrase-like pyridoxal-dependent ACC family enzyme